MAPKVTRRSKGTGGIYQRASDNMWCASIELPPAADGKRRRRVIVRARKADVIAEMRAAQRELQKAGNLRTSSPTLAQWCDLWWNRYGMTKLKVTTRDAYRSKIEQYIKPAIGRIRLDRLTVDHVHKLHAYVTTTKGLSASTAAGAHRVLSSILADAEKEGRVTRNVARVADKPRVAKKRKEYLTNAQAARLLASLAHDPQELAIWGTALLLGKRLGEVLGIHRDLVDVANGQLTIAWQVKRVPFEHGCGPATPAGARPCGRQRGGNCPDRRLTVPADQEVIHLDGGLYLLRPKTKSSWHALPMVGLLQQLIGQYLETAPTNPHGLLFARPDGRPIDPADANKAWHAHLKAASLPDVDVHSTRHTCNTVLTELGVPVDVRRLLLGHASAAVNEAVYTHTSDVRVADAMRQLGAALGPATT